MFYRHMINLSVKLEGEFGAYSDVTFLTMEGSSCRWQFRVWQGVGDKRVCTDHVNIETRL